MEYAEGTPGRIFTLRIDNEEDILETLGIFLKEKDVNTGVLFFLGALKRAKLITGPKEAVFPPVPNEIIISGGHEIIGIGTVYKSENGPSLHIHTSAGRKEETLTGCLREFAEVYLIAEVVILEFMGISAIRAFDPKLGASIPRFDV